MQRGQPTCQAGIIMQMIAAIEAQRHDKHLVALCVGLLKALLAVRISPRGRDDDRQLDPWMGSDLLKLALVRANQAGLGDHHHTQAAWLVGGIGRQFVCPFRRVGSSCDIVIIGPRAFVKQPIGPESRDGLCFVIAACKRYYSSQENNRSAFVLQDAGTDIPVAAMGTGC